MNGYHINDSKSYGDILLLLLLHNNFP